jgi:hypothetical protein
VKQKNEYMYTYTMDELTSLANRVRDIVLTDLEELLFADEEAGTVTVGEIGRAFVKVRKASIKYVMDDKDNTPCLVWEHVMPIQPREGKSEAVQD